MGPPSQGTEVEMVTAVVWVVAITVGLAAGGFALHFPGSYGASSWSVVAGLFGLILGAMNGLLVGALGWVALRLQPRTGTRLVLAMAMIVGATHALNDGSSSEVPFVFVQTLAGILAAGAWAVVMGERRPAFLGLIGGAWWVGLLVAARSGDILGLPWTETPIGWSLDHAWDGLVTGTIWAVATAAIGLPAALRARRHPARWSVRSGVAGDRTSGKAPGAPL